jgi:hypothetical protein
VEQKVEHHINDYEEHHDSDDVSDIHGLASWTSVPGKPLSDVSAAESGNSLSLLREGITGPSRKGGLATAPLPLSKITVADGP